MPSARPTLDADHPLLQASSQYEYSQDQPQHSEEQQLQQPIEVLEPCTEVLHDGCHTWQAETSATAAAEPGLAAVASTSGAGEEAVHAAEEVSDMHNTGDTVAQTNSRMCTCALLHICSKVLDSVL